jgi:hypothetical protein
VHSPACTIHAIFSCLHYTSDIQPFVHSPACTIQTIFNHSCILLPALYTQYSPACTIQAICNHSCILLPALYTQYLIIRTFSYLLYASHIQLYIFTSQFFGYLQTYTNISHNCVCEICMYHYTHTQKYVTNTSAKRVFKHTHKHTS